MKLQCHLIESSLSFLLCLWLPFCLYLPVLQVSLIGCAGFFAGLLIFETILRFYGRLQSLSVMCLAIGYNLQIMFDTEEFGLLKIP